MKRLTLKVLAVCLVLALAACAAPAKRSLSGSVLCPACGAEIAAEEIGG